MGSGDLARGLARDPDGVPLSPADRAMIDYAGKLTRTPGAMGPADAEALRAEGFSDAAILDVCQVVAYYNYVNRLADGLGVELEDEWTDDDLTLTRAEFEARTRRGDARGGGEGPPPSASR